MLQVTIHEAKTHLSRLIRKALAGEEVIIARGQTPLVRLSALSVARSRRIVGDCKGRIRISDDFDEPLEAFDEHQ